MDPNTKIETFCSLHDNLDFNEKLKVLKEHIYDEVTKPSMRQETPFYRLDVENGSQCCFGARVAKVLVDLGVLNPSSDMTIHFSLGRKFILVLLGLSRKQLELIFWACGAGSDQFCYTDYGSVNPARSPFGSYHWNRPVHEVLQKLIQIEKPPSKELFKQIVKRNPYFRHGKEVITQEQAYELILKENEKHELET